MPSSYISYLSYIQEMCSVVCQVLVCANKTQLCEKYCYQLLDAGIKTGRFVVHQCTHIKFCTCLHNV